jgi:hypothetical protein
MIFMNLECKHRKYPGKVAQGFIHAAVASGSGCRCVLPFPAFDAGSSAWRCGSVPVRNNIRTPTMLPERQQNANDAADSQPGAARRPRPARLRSRVGADQAVTAGWDT